MASTELTGLVIPNFQPGFLDAWTELQAGLDLMNATIRFTQHARIKC